MPDEERDSHAVPNTLSDGKEIIKGVLDRHKEVTLKAFALLPEATRLTVYILWTISVLAALMGFVFVVAERQTFGLVIVLASLACIMISVVLQNKPTRTSPKQLGELVREQIPGPSWARAVPKVPISPPEKLDGFQLLVRQIRTAATAKLNDIRKKAGRPEIEDARIRTNVFLVNTREVAESGALALIIPKRMHDNMREFKDRDIRILPHEGLTGRTFTLGEACGATATPDADGRLNWSKVDLFPERPSSDEWNRFVLSEEQNALIGSRLRWIISFPLSHDGQGRDKTFGVLNIDGLDDALPKDEMKSLARSMEPNVANFASSIAALPRARISIRVEDVE